MGEPLNPHPTMIAVLLAAAGGEGQLIPALPKERAEGCSPMHGAVVKHSMTLLFAFSSMCCAVEQTDVPDEFGLGERLALVAWLTDRHVAIADPNDVPALRRNYTALAHPAQTTAADSAKREQQRADLAADLYRKFGRNPPVGASVDEISALITSLTDHANQANAKDQALAQGGAPAQSRTGPTPASGAPDTTPRQEAADHAPIDVPGATAIDVSFPAGWTVVKIQPNPTMPPTLRISCVDDHEVSLQITFIPDKDGRFDSQEKIDKVVANMGRQYADGSEEKEIRLNKLATAHGLGSYARFTDADLVGKPNAPGHYKVVASGMLVIGKSAGAFTLLANSFDQPGYRQALAILQEHIAAHK